MLAVFRDALWGNAILLPLDIGPTLYSKYKWLDPTAGNVPRNHYVIDIFDYDLSRTYVAYRSLAQGEFPWWDPYSNGGGPLAAETHFGVTEPLKLAIFSILPFPLACNWTRILGSFLGALGMFLLLRRLGFAQFTTVLGALSFQFAAPQSGFHYTISPHGWFYYPYLWLVMHHYADKRPTLTVALAGILCAAMFMAGTQQSHIYVGLFLLCIVIGYGSCGRLNMARLVTIATCAFLLGCALAAPILAPQVELFALSDRQVALKGFGVYLVTGLISLAGIFPWFTGSFRTLDVPRLVGYPSAAYVVYVGTAAMILAVIGLIIARKLPKHVQPQARTASLLVVGYFLGICSTPLVNILYVRSSILAVIGLVVLFALGWEALLTTSAPANLRRIARFIVGLLSVGIIVTHVFAFAVYPRIKGRVLEVVLQKEAQNRSMPSAPDLRRSQVNSLPNEITFKNPEPLLAFLGALCLLGVASMRPNLRRFCVAGVFAFNLLPLLLFANRSTPYSPVRLWHSLLRGGPEQTALIALVGPDLRMTEQAPGRLGFVFPGTMAGLYQVHSLRGWASMSLLGPGQANSPRDYNILCSSTPGGGRSEVIVVHTNQVRFVWENKMDREVSIVRETPNSIELRVAAGKPGQLVRTDTYYPGWRVERPAGIAQRRNADGFWAFSIPSEATTLVLRYRPSYSEITTPLFLAALGVTGVLIVMGSRRPVQVEQGRPG